MERDGKKQSISGIMALAALGGAILGGGLGALFIPKLAAGVAIGGAMTATAAVVAWILFRNG
ncbi:hypothetical protein [uncultured Tateyamaria sp.]|uniref:hypothetical protein n=1 Tax=uncultured Tateyamaria sp. TaxID=455651 RepID=UPI002606E9E6|nr:hypothetical protein [uncultured Tateyamaria sp.]